MMKSSRNQSLENEPTSLSNNNTHKLNKDSRLITIAAAVIAIAQLFLFVSSALLMSFEFKFEHISFFVINGLSLVVTLLALIQSFYPSNQKKAVQTTILYLSVFQCLIQVNVFVISAFNIINIIALIIAIISLVCGIIALATANFKTITIFKIFTCVVAGIGVFAFIFSDVIALIDLSNNGVGARFSNFFSFIGGIIATAGSVTFLLYALKRVIDSVRSEIPNVKVKETTSSFSSVEKKLKALKDLRESGSITEEEYKKIREKYLETL